MSELTIGGYITGKHASIGFTKSMTVIVLSESSDTNIACVFYATCYIHVFEHAIAYCCDAGLLSVVCNIGVLMRAPLLLLCLLWSLVEVHSQTEYPYVSFMGETLPNHAYVDLSLVGNDTSGNDSVQCHTDLVTCCRSSYGIYRGDWIPPGSEMRLPYYRSLELGGIRESREAQRVDLRYWNSSVNVSSGIYRCDIPTNAVHNEDDTSVRMSVYVGLYASGGEQDTDGEGG